MPPCMYVKNYPVLIALCEDTDIDTKSDSLKKTLVSKILKILVSKIVD